MRFAFFFCAVFLLLFPIQGSENTAHELDSYLQEITTKNPAFQAAHQRWLAAQEQVEIVSTLPEPTANLGIFVQEVETRVGPQKQRLGFKQAIPWKGKRALKGDRAQEQANKAREAMGAIRLRLVTEFKRLYAEYYYLGKSIAITKDHLSLLKDLEMVVTERYQTNAAQYNDLIRIQIEIEGLSDRLKTQQESAPPISAAMNALLSRPVGQTLPFAPTLPDLHLPDDWSHAELLAKVASRHPDLKVLDRQVAADRVSVALAKKNYYPDFQVGLDWINTGKSISSTTPENGKDPIILSVGVKLPIQRKKYRAIERAKAFQVTASEKQREDTQAHLQASLKHGMFQLDDANRKIILYRDQIIPKAEESLNVTMSGFQTGDASYLDLINAEKVLLEFQLSFNLAESDRLKAMAAMEAALGEPPFLPTSKE